MTSCLSGSRTLASYSYTQDRNRYLSCLTYGNQDWVQYSYDNLGRVTAHTYEDGDTVSYRYDNNGSLARVEDSATGRTTAYYYDFAGRSASYRTTGSNYSHGVSYGYDGQNNLTTVTEEINGQTRTTTYGYDGENRLTYLSDGTTSRSYTYDGMNRLLQETTVRDGQTVLTVSYEYLSKPNDIPTALLNSMTISSPGLTDSITLYYYYDSNGNITGISSRTDYIEYTYDSANQLIEEGRTSNSTAYSYTYDNAGNITSRTDGNYVIGVVMPGTTHTYSYEDSQWGDLLTGYDGQVITSDAIGNVLSDGNWTYTWEHGRQLAAMTHGATTWTYTYDADGMRTSRTNGTTTYSYIYNGSQLSQMTMGNDTLRFSYDAMGSPMTVTWNGEVYTYVTNLQGDVMYILDSTGNPAVSYDYSAYGCVVNTSGAMALTLGALNPLRYRGYVYDVETRFYYLQSRYYNPELGRFISPDAFVATGQGFVGNNMFAYCNNNPVIFSDSTGNLPIRSTEFGAAAMLRDGTATRGGIIPDKVREAEELEKQGKNLLNTSEEAVIAADDFAFYKGVLYVKGDIGDGGAFSLGFVLMDDSYGNNDLGINTVRHEYGHARHLADVGMNNYLIKVAIPSLIGAALTNAKILEYDRYYDLPWEYIANQYGDAEFGEYLPGTETIGAVYWIWTAVP